MVKPSLLTFLCLHVQTSWFNGLEINFKNSLIIYFIFWYIYQLVGKNSWFLCQKFISDMRCFFAILFFLLEDFIYIKKLEKRSRSYITGIARVILQGLHQRFCAVLLVEIHFADISRTRIIFHYIVLILFKNFPETETVARGSSVMRGVLKNISKLLRKHLCLLFSEVTVLGLLFLLKRRMCYSCEFSKMFDQYSARAFEGNF